MAARTQRRCRAFSRCRKLRHMSDVVSSVQKKAAQSAAKFTEGEAVWLFLCFIPVVSYGV
jgi:hypothetical protein